MMNGMTQMPDNTAGSASKSGGGENRAAGPDQRRESGSESAGIEIEPAAAVEVFGDGVELARRYVESLAVDGVVRGLIGPREAGRLWTRHVLNSAVAGTLLVAGCRVVDIGSGAGLPGIPLAIARPDCEFVLVEPLERRAVYLGQVVVDLGLSNCRVVRGRAEQVINECGDADVVTSRAVAPLDRLAAWSAPLLRIGGQLLALKGSSAADEILRDGAAAASVGLVDLEVIAVGVDIVEPVTLIVRGRRIAVTKSSPRKNMSGIPRKADRRPPRR
jgi:16S rRNA (guanine527-N7)-methyltransferase